MLSPSIRQVDFKFDRLMSRTWDCTFRKQTTQDFRACWIVDFLSLRREITKNCPGIAACCRLILAGNVGAKGAD
jgi:hypothetical protein